MKREIIIYLGILLLSSCISTQINSTNIITETPLDYANTFTNNLQNLEKTATPSPTDDGKSYLGDYVAWDGYFAAALQIEDPFPPNEWYWPDKGEKIVSVFIIIGNQTGKQIQFMFSNLWLHDNSGGIFMATYAGHKNSIVDAYIDHGERLQGWIDFVIPEDIIPEVLVYSFKDTSDKSVAIPLTRPPVGRRPHAVDTSRKPITNSKLGENDVGSGFSLRAYKIEDPTMPAFPEYFEQTPSTHLVGVEFELRNISGEIRKFYNYGIKLVDVNGFLYEIEFNGKYFSDSYIFLRGESRSGGATFLVPDGTKLESLKYYSAEMNKPLWAGLQ